MSRSRPASPSSASTAPDIPLRDPALASVALLAAAIVVLLVSFRMWDADVWQHLTAGKAIWTLHRIPMTNFSTWSHLGEPQVLRSWLFCALLWPVYALGSIPGLFAWRWLTTLAAFGLTWATARRMGARGFTPLPVIVWCVLVYRGRSMVRPETLVAVLMAAQFWILEQRRAGGRDWSLWLIAILCVWANAHISYYLGLVLIAIYWLDERWRLRTRPRAKRPAARSLVLVGLAAAAACFVNPWGWKALWLPFEYALYWRHEAVFASIPELAPPNWANHLRDGLPLLMVLWPVLAVRRTTRRGPDVAEALTLGLFSALALSSQRFLGSYAVVAAPFVARDLAEALAGTTWRVLPASIPGRAALAASIIVLGALPELIRPDMPIAIAMDSRVYPNGAMDWLQRNAVRGRGFNQFGISSTMLYRGWPDVGRLPFIDIHQTGSTRDRYEYAWSQQDPRAWHALDARWHFDYAVLDRGPLRNVTALEILDADSSWAMCFSDDAAAVYLKRDGPFGTLASRSAYTVLGGGVSRSATSIAAVSAGSQALGSVRAEVERMVGDSPAHAGALVLLGHASQAAHQAAPAESAYRAALRVQPVSGAHAGLGLLALGSGRARDAIVEFRAEWDAFGSRPGTAFNLAAAYRAAGDAAAARRWYRRELHDFPNNAAARDSLAALDPGR